MPDILSTPITGQSIVAPSESGGVSVQSDWDENNPQSKAYIQNKPFYEEFGEKELVYGPTSIDKAGAPVPDVSEDIYYIQFQTTLSGDFTFNENDHLVLMLDDTEFEFALEGSSNFYRNINSESDLFNLLSNGSVAYQLGMKNNTWTFFAMIPVTSSNQKTYTVSIYKIELNIRKLPARFIDLKVPQNIMDGSAIASVRCVMAAQENDQYTIGQGAFAEGVATTASGAASHAEGSATTASGIQSHAEGDGAIASGSQSHAEGYNTRASGTISHAEGNNTIASGLTSHTEGLQTIANHASQHVFGQYNIADSSTARSDVRGTYVEIVGNGTKNGKTESRSNARTLDWNGNEVLAGKLTVGAAPTADMDVTTKKYVDDNSDKFPEITAADDGKIMVAVNGEWVNEDLLTISAEHVILPETEGVNLNNPYNIDLTAFPSVPVYDLQYIAVYNGRRYELGTNMFDLGAVAVYPSDYDIMNLFNSSSSMPEIAIMINQGDGIAKCVVMILPEDTGNNTLTLMAKVKTVVKNEHLPFLIKAGSGAGSIAEGFYTIASGLVSHAEGQATNASGRGSHAEGNGTIASGDVSHAEGQTTTASGGSSHAEGAGTTASGEKSHAEGLQTIANHASQHVFGEYNVADPSTANTSSRGTYIEIVGNGTKNGKTESRSNARTLDWDGNEVLAGGLTVGAAGITIGNTTITESQLTYLLSLVQQEP